MFRRKFLPSWAYCTIFDVFFQLNWGKFVNNCDMAKILNNILCTAMIFMLTFAWAVFCLKEAKLALLLAAIVAVAGGYIIFAVLTKRQNIKEAKRRRKKLLNNFFELLRFNTDNQALFEKMFEFFRYEVTRIDFDSAVICREKRSFAALCFQTESLSAELLQQAIVCAKRQKCQQLMVFCNKAENSLQTLANSQISTKFVDLENTFALFEQAEKLPPLSNTKSAQIHVFPQYAFNKKRFGWYFSGALFTLFTAAFSFLKAYLLVWSTALLGLAMFSLFNKKYNKTPTDVKLE